VVFDGWTLYVALLGRRANPDECDDFFCFRIDTEGFVGRGRSRDASSRPFATETLCTCGEHHVLDGAAGCGIILFASKRVITTDLTDDNHATGVGDLGGNGFFFGLAQLFFLGLNRNRGGHDFRACLRTDGCETPWPGVLVIGGPMASS